MTEFDANFSCADSLMIDTRPTIDRDADGCTMRGTGPGSALVKTCLPALTVLERNGVSCLSLLLHFEEGVGCDWYIKEPRFFSDIRVLKRHLEEVRAAFSTVFLAIQRAIEGAIEGTDHEESSFLASVHVSRSDRPEGWSIDCEITAVIDVTSQGDVIKLP